MLSRMQLVNPNGKKNATSAKRMRAKKAAARKESAPVVIPDKLYFRIGEVADLCRLPAYVLRFWESEFPHLRPNKSGTGQRMYRRRDVEAVLRIKELLYDQGFTIAGARQYLRDEIKTGRLQPALPFTGGNSQSGKLKPIRKELKQLLDMLSE